MPKRKLSKTIYQKGRHWSFLNVVVFLVLAALLSGGLLFVYFIKDLPRPEKFTEGIINQSTKIYDRNGQILLYEISGEEKRTIVSLAEIPEFLKNAIIATEDKNFFEHRGFDIKGVLRAVLYDLKLKKPVQGASTLTQQLIRTYFLTRQKTLERKTREIILSIELERHYPKEQILEWYLNIVPFGSNIYGVEAASRFFFGKSVSEISLAEAAALTALIKAPSYFSPYGEHKKELLERKNYVLDRLVKLNYLKEEDAEKAKKEEIVFQPKKESILAPHFVFFVKKYLEEKYGTEFLTQKGLKVYTTIDFEIQKTIEDLSTKWAEQIKAFNAHNIALVALNPKTGEVLSMVGSKNYFGEPEPKNCQPGLTCQFDPNVNAAIALRQPGSALKPFIYALAFQKGFTPNSLVWDVKTEFNLNCSPDADQEFSPNGSKCYHPQNYDGKFFGPITLRSALAQSRNIPAVKILYLAGLNEVLDFLPNFGITTLKDKTRYGLSLVLGSGEVSLLELTSAYSVFANEGYRLPLNFIKKIEDSEGNILEEAKTERIKVIPSQIAQEINSILSDNAARTPVFGANSSLKLAHYQAAVKTGTNQDHRDEWIVGYTPSLVIGIWTGNNDNSPMSKKAAVAVVGPLWNKLMETLLPKFPKEEFTPPPERKSGEPILDGLLPGNHSLLYYLNPNDPQLSYWEKAIENWLRPH